MGGAATMDSGYYAAFTGLLARTEALEVAANNMANLSTTGYRAQREFYRSLTAALNQNRLSPLNQAVNNYGVLGGTLVDLRTGALERTGNELDLAFEGSGFFAVQTRAGIRYTRNGNFRAGTDGRLVTAAGDVVLGEQGPVQIPSGPISVSSNGTISQKGGLVARLRLVDFAPGTLLTPEGNSLYSAPAGSERPAQDPRLRQGMLEGANLNPVAASVSLIALQRQAELLQRALSVFHTDFNRTAAEELPRV